MRFLRHGMAGLFLVGLTVALLIYAGTLMVDAIQARSARDVGIPQDRERVFAVNLVTATSAEIVPVMTAFGEVQSRRTLDIRAAVGGTVVELADGFVEGGQVEKDALLVRIDPANAIAARDRALSDMRDAEAEQRDSARALKIAQDEVVAAQDQADLRERAFQRQQDLKARGVGTEATVEPAELAASAARAAVLSRRQAVAQAEARVDQAKTRLARAAIALDEAERRLADTTIRAAFSGTLGGVTLVEGGLVAANERLAQLIDPDALEVAFRVSTTQYARLLDDDGALIQAPAKVTLDVFGVDLTATGVLERAGASVGAGQSGRLLFARLDRTRGLKPGDFVTVEIAEPMLRDVVSLPASALDAAGSVLALAASEDRLEEVGVQVIRRQGDDVLVASEGIAGREVVRERSPLLGAGIKVRPLRDASDQQTVTSSDAGAAEAAAEMLELSAERRAALVAFVEGNARMPEDVKSRLLSQLQAERVPARVVARLESRMGG